MDKIKLSILVVAAMMLTFAGCKKEEVYNPKEGEYNPKKKISRIFEETSYSNGKKLRETWTWNGNLLDKIADSYGNFAMFEYDDKQLKTVRFSDGDRMEFTYNVDNKVTACNCYGDGKLEGTYTFTHDGSKISKIVYTRCDNDKKSMQSGKAHLLLNYIMPGTKLAENVDRLLLTKVTKGKGNFTYTMSFEWDGDNVSKVTYEDTKQSESETIQYTYDKMSNPYYCSLYHYMDDDESHRLSKNNVTKVVYTDSEGDYDEETFTYTYDGNFPVQQKYFDNEDNYYRITYYEYQ